MKRVTMFIVFVVAASLLLSAIVSPIGVLAQTGTGSGTGTPNAGGTGVPNTGNQSGGPAFVNLQTLQAFQVEDVHGNALGNVSDFVINLPKTRIDYIVMAGNNGRSVLVPWSSLASVDAGRKMFTFYQDRSRLENAPNFDANSIDFTNPNWSESTVNYWRFGVGGVNANNGGNNGQPPSATAQSGNSGSASATGTVQPTGQAQNGNSSNGNAGQNNGPRTGAVAVLASKLLNSQIVDISTSSRFDTTFGNNSSNNNQANNNSNSGSTAQSGTSVPNTGSAQATPMGTSVGTSVPNTGNNGSQSNQNNGQANGEVLGTVAGAIVTRINGDIRWILVRPEGTLAESIRQASLNAQNNNQNNGGSVPNTGGSSQSGTAQPSVSVTAQPTDQSAGQSPTVQATGSVPNTGGSNQSASGNDVIPVPFDTMFPKVQNGNLVLRASPYMLRAAPVVASNIDNLGFGWDMNINQFWGSGGLLGGRFPLFSNNNQLQAGTGGGVPVTGSDQASMASSAFVQLNALQNYAIQDGSGNSLGTINDFVVNIPKTRIDYVVVSSSDGRQVLVPWAALASVDTSSKVFYFRYPGDNLKNAPVFNANDFNFSDPEWDNSVLNYWITGRNASNNNGSSNSNNSSNSTAQGTSVPNTGNAQATPMATSVGTSVPNTGNNGAQNGNNGQFRSGAVAVLASQLVGAPVYDVTSATATGNNQANSQNSNNNSSSQAQGTPMATGTVESGTSQGTSVPNTGNNNTNNQGNTNDQVGTVRGAIVTRLNGDIRYLLIEPAAGIANTGGNNQVSGTPQAAATSTSGSDTNSVQTTGTPEASSSNGSGTTQGTSVPNTGSNSTNNGQTGNTGGLIPVPFTSNMVGNNNGQLFVRVSTAMLRNAPTLSNAPDVLGFGFDQGILNFWNTGRLNNNSNSNP